LKSAIKTILVEAVVVAIVGVGVALAANQLSNCGLVLSRNYFPGGTNPVSAALAPALVAPGAVDTNEPSPAEQLSERLRGKGLQEMLLGQAKVLFHDPGDKDGRVVFVDARDEDHFQDGHIPGAYELDPYHPEKELGTVLNVCQAAEKVVVYCTGGECEDGDTAAILLRDGGVPAGQLFVYGGGFTEWEAGHLPVETGARNSGTLKSFK
jgi:rhodanese-related sulfurtransferase